jgi:hypothetical protein
MSHDHTNIFRILEQQNIMIHPSNVLSDCQQQNRSNDTLVVNQQYLNQKWEFSHEPTYYLKAEKQGYPIHIFSYFSLFYF